MGINIGLDIGAISLKLAALGKPADRATLEAVRMARPEFRLISLDDRPLLLSDYRRISGSPIQSTYDLLHELYEIIPEGRVEGIRVTGSGSRTIAKVLGLFFENEFKAIARMIATWYPQVRTVFELGGESSKYIRLENGGIQDYDRSGECAAGTGSFLDQQALRMQYSVEEVGELVCGAGCAARIAGRCSVFAKSDMIHAQQKGYSPAEILRGLCDAVARNFKSSVVKGRPVEAPVALIGAVSQNAGVVRALREAFSLTAEQLFVPEEYAWCGAIGTAILEAEEQRKRSILDVHRLRQHDVEESIQDTKPLSSENVVQLRNRVGVYAPPAAHLSNGEPIAAYLGLDIGSVSTNVVAIDEFGAVIHDVYLRTAGRPIEAVQQGLAEVERIWGSRLKIRGVGTTGSGRELIAEFVGADVVNDEITAHKTGAIHISSTLGGEPVDTIFEIGGQDSKFIRIRDGVVVDFTMNEACAAGTGSFLEEQAEKLGVDIKGEFAQLALSSRNPIRLGERCTVFMARDVSSLLLKGAAAADLCAGLAYSVALNYLNRVVRGRNLGNVIYFQGGTAYNDAVAAAFSVILKKPIVVPPHNGVIGAIGMALIARDRVLASGETSRFRGFDLNRMNFTSRDFVCRACSNYCEMKEFSIDGEKSYWGDQCSDKFRKRSRTDRQPVIEDLLSGRDKLLEAALEPPREGRRTVGIPRAMFFYDRFPFWCTYLQELGYNVAVSPPTDGRIAAIGEELAIAQPCFPIQVAHGHVHALLKQGVDYILLPNTVDAETPFMQAESKLCPWNQSLPFVVRAVEKLENDLDGKLLCPTIHFRQGPQHVRKQLRILASTLGRNKAASDAAAEHAYRAQQKFGDTARRAGEAALQVLRATHEPAIVLLGRPYNIYDRAVCCDIPRKLRTLYGINVLPLDFLPLDDEDVSAINDNMYWHSGRLILAAAQFTRRIPGLHLIYMSNFKCGPDSYLKSFLEDACGKPSLVLQFDGHSNDAGYITRCEAYLDSKGFLRCNSTNIAA